MSKAEASRSPCSYRPDPDAIASAVLSRFAALPSNCKPRSRSANDAAQEWVPLAGIVAEDTTATPNTYRCLTLATGMKCATQAHLSSSAGHILHDSHAEILCLRAFNRLLLQDALLPSPTLLDRCRGSQPFRLRPGLKLHMYASTAPCGDASMELVMARQPDATPWEVPSDRMPGRGGFGLLGVVRRKPARPDAPLALSKSCSDKLALAQCLGLLSGLTALLVDCRGFWLTSLVLPRGEIHGDAMERAFGPEGRMRDLVEWAVGEYAYRPFTVLATEMVYPFSRPEGASKGSEKAAVVLDGTAEVVINGVLQGRKQSDVNGASCVSRRRMWALAREISSQAEEQVMGCLDAVTYSRLKEADALADRRTAKAQTIERALQGWTRNTNDRDWKS